MAKPSLKHILYVEDDNDIRELVRITLNALGDYQVDTCINGQDALDKSKELKPQLVMLDVMMPDINGPSVLDALRKIPQYQNIPFIFLTGKVQNNEIEEYKKMGLAGVISKPFNPVELPDMIESIWSDYHKKDKNQYNDSLEQLRQNYLNNLNSAIQDIQHQLIALEQNTFSVSELEKFKLAIGNIQGSGESFGYQDLSSSAQILLHSLDEIKAVDATIQLSDHEKSRLSALMLALITIIEKTVAGYTNTSSMAGSLSFD